MSTGHVPPMDAGSSVLGVAFVIGMNDIRFSLSSLENKAISRRQSGHPESHQTFNGGCDGAWPVLDWYLQAGLGRVPYSDLIGTVGGLGNFN